MTDRKRTKEELLEALRGEIFAAEVKVILDKQLGRKTSPTVQKLAALKLAPASRTTVRLQPQPDAEPLKASPRRTRHRFVTNRHVKGLAKSSGSSRSATTGTFVPGKDSLGPAPERDRLSTN